MSQRVEGERLPLAIDLFCGLGGWTSALLAEGYRVIGFDIEAHNYGTGCYPGQLVLQDVTTLHGSQFKDAALIVASPPCTEPSFRAMPWKKAKAQVPEVLPIWWVKSEKDMTAVEMDEWVKWRAEHPKEPPLNFIRLFDACFRIQREAEEAAGHHIPLIVENVRGAQKWVGRAKWNFGSYYLWGDVPALMPITLKAQAQKGIPHRTAGHWTNPAEHEGVKEGGDWWDKECRKTGMARFGSKSNARKAASAMIAKIPFALAQHIAQTFYPRLAEYA